MFFILIRNNLIIWITLFCLIQLSGCSFSSKYSSSKDGPPAVDFDASKIPDAIPKNEPINASCNKPYVVHGHKYYVLKNAKGYHKVGTASWYGTKFHGRKTSNNERYNLYSMTAASTVLPIPTYVQVTNLENGNQVVVKVNDRGPFRGNRLIDVSYAAAKKLGFAGKGTAKVEVKAIDPNNWHSNQPIKNTVDYPLLAKNDDISSVKLKNKKDLSNKPAKNEINISQDNKLAENKAYKSYKPTDQKLYVQAGSFSKLDNAKKLSAKINKLIATPTKINRKTHNKKSIYEVNIGPLANSTQSQLIKQLLESHGLGKAQIITS